jgi:thiol-disulfide isomerase/thioredoxin
MIRSTKFWVGAILFSFIPLLLIDISVHVIDWKKEVREEIITLVHNADAYTKSQKTEALDVLLERERTLNFLLYFKSFLCLFLLSLSIYFFRKFGKQREQPVWKPIAFTIALAACFLAVKIIVVTQTLNNNKIKILSFAPTELSFEDLYDKNFRGKVVYVDFWGTTCGPCLQEFRNFTKSLKERYQSEKELAYLYVSQGNEYLWKKQIEKYNVEGYHIFIDGEQYEKLYKKAVNDSSTIVTMPRYLIINKKGEIVVTDAKRPSENDMLYKELDKYLAQNN